MIPFPGESLALADAADGTDHSLFGAVTKRGGYFPLDPESATLTAGSTWRAWVMTGTASYLEAGSDAAVSWVVEVLSGTATVTAAETIDADWPTDGLAAGTALGTYTVTGPATLVIPSTFTAADVLTDSGEGLAMMLQLDATSGSIDVQQVKLRVWPPDGALGAWVDQPSWETTPAAPVVKWHYDSPGNSWTDIDRDVAWKFCLIGYHLNAADALAARDRTFGERTVSGSIGQTMTEHNDPTEFVATMGSTLVLILVVGADWESVDPVQPGLVDGVDYIRPPSEVAVDPDSWVDITGTGSTGWAGDTAVYSTAPDPDDVPGRATYYSQAGAWPFVGGPYNIHAPITIGAPGYGRLPLDTSGPRILISVAHESVLGNDADGYPGWDTSIFATVGRSEDMGAELGAMTTYAVMPPYRVWVPTAVAESVVRWWPRNDGLLATSPPRIGQMSSRQSGRGGGYQ